MLAPPHSPRPRSLSETATPPRITSERKWPRLGPSTRCFLTTPNLGSARTLKDYHPEFSEGVVLLLKSTDVLGCDLERVVLIAVTLAESRQTSARLRRSKIKTVVGSNDSYRTRA
jgi:hypothetical protein